ELELGGLFDGKVGRLRSLRILSTCVAARMPSSRKLGAYAMRPPASAYSLNVLIDGKRLFIARVAICVRYATNTGSTITVNAVGPPLAITSKALSISLASRAPNIWSWISNDRAAASVSLIIWA